MQIPSKNAFSLCFLVVFWLVSFIPSCIIVLHKYTDKSIHMYENLHAMENPTTTSDLVLLAMQTPGLSMQLASAWEIENALDMPSKTLRSSYSMLYPLMEGTNDINQLLLRQANITGQTYCAACDAQKMFKISNALKESQKYQYCPKRGENKSAWLIRTGQEKEKDERDSYFHFNNEHPEFCRKTRLPSMVLGHISTNSFSIFSAQDYDMLLLIIGTVNVLFSFSIGIYKGWAMRLPSVHSSYKPNVAGQFSFLFLFLLLISLIPMLSDFIQTGDGKLLYKKSLGSFLVGLWTITFSIVYIYVIPRMHVKLETPDTPETESNKRPTKDPLIIQYLFSNQSLISLAYWNFMQAPCIVMAILAKYRYGIDVYMQFIVFGTIAITVLDIIHTRVNMISGLTRGVLEEVQHSVHSLPTYMDAIVCLTFIAMNLVISIPIMIKLKQMDVSDTLITAVGLLFYLHPSIKLIALMYRYVFTRKISTTNPEEVPLKTDADTKQDQQTNTKKKITNSTFNHILWLHMLMTVIVCSIVYFVKA